MGRARLTQRYGREGAEAKVLAATPYIKISKPVGGLSLEVETVWEKLYLVIAMPGDGSKSGQEVDMRRFSHTTLEISSPK